MRKLSSSSQIEMVIKAFTTVANTTVTAKTKYLTAKPKTSRQNQNTSRQNQNPHCKILHSKNQIPHGKSKYPRQNQSYFDFAVKYLVLPWSFWFCRDVFCFCREVAVTVVGQKNLGSHPDLSRQTWEVACRTLFVCLFVFFWCVVFCKKYTAARIAEPRSNKKMMGEVPRCFFLSPPPHCI